MLLRHALCVLVLWTVACGEGAVDGQSLDAALVDGGTDGSVGDGSIADAADAAEADEDAADAADADVDAAVSTEGGACGIASRQPGNALAVAACRAIAPFADGEFTLPLDVLLGDVTARRFEIGELDNLWPAYQSALAADSTVQLRVYARVGDASVKVTASDLAALDSSVDIFTAPALHCLDHPLPDNYAQILADNAALGGYPLSHVLMALMMLDDQGCESPTDEAFYESVVAATAELIDTRHAYVNDLEIEAAAFLAYIDEAHRIPDGFLEGVLAGQQASGGWSLWGDDELANGHTTGLALWYLHEMLLPGSTHPLVNPNARGVQ